MVSFSWFGLFKVQSSCAQQNSLSAFGLSIQLEEDETFKDEYSWQHKIYKSYNNGTYVQSFYIGIISKYKLEYFTKGLKQGDEPFAPFKPEIYAELKDLEQLKQYGQTGRGKKAQIEGHLFIAFDDFHYLHFYLKKDQPYFDEAVAAVNNVLGKVRLNVATSKGFIDTEKCKNFGLKSMQIEGSHYYRNDNFSRLLLRKGPLNQIAMLWSDAANRHYITCLSTEGKVEKELEFDDSRVYDLVAHEESFVVLISHPNLNKDGDLKYYHLNMEKYTWDKKLIWSTHLMGVDDINKVGDQRFEYWGNSSTRLAWSGTYYAAYFASYRKWPDLVTHQGDVFLTLTDDGEIMMDMTNYRAFNSTWDVSHSFAQELIFDGKKFYRFALGDAYPRAINVERSYPINSGLYQKNAYCTEKFLEFPGESGDNYVYDTEFSAPIVSVAQLFTYPHLVNIKNITN